MPAAPVALRAGSEMPIQMAKGRTTGSQGSGRAAALGTKVAKWTRGPGGWPTALAERVAAASAALAPEEPRRPTALPVELTPEGQGAPLTATCSLRFKAAAVAAAPMP